MATRAQLMEAIEYAQTNGWKQIDGSTLLRKWTVDTPEINRSKGPDDTFGKWAGDTFDRLIFVTVIGLTATRTGSVGVAVGRSRAPWMGLRDQSVSIKEAIRVLTATYDNEGNEV